MSHLPPTPNWDVGFTSSTNRKNRRCRLIKSLDISTSLYLGAVLMIVLMTEMGQAFVKAPITAVPPTLKLSTAISKQKIPAAIWELQNENGFPGIPVVTKQTSLSMAAADGEKSKLPFWLDPGTRGGAVFLSFILFLLPLGAYSVVTNVFGVEGTEAGKWIGVGFTATASFLWVGTYIFRVATKDMTYVSFDGGRKERIYSLLEAKKARENRPNILLSLFSIAALPVPRQNNLKTMKMP